MQLMASSEAQMPDTIDKTAWKITTDADAALLQMSPEFKYDKINVFVDCSMKCGKPSSAPSAAPTSHPSAEQIREREHTSRRHQQMVSHEVQSNKSAAFDFKMSERIMQMQTQQEQAHKHLAVAVTRDARQKKERHIGK